jgi:lipopolysaccharide export system protein LptA
MKLLRLLPLLALATVPLSAQTAPQASTSPVTPVETVITASSAEIWSNEAGTETYAIFKGNVVVTGTNLRMTCDRIEATSIGSNDPLAKNTTAQDVEKFKTLLATGKVHIVQGDREANCERAEVLPREGKIVLTGTAGHPPIIIDRGSGVTWISEPAILLKNDRRVHGENVKIIFPPVQDLGFDKNAPATTTTPADAAPKP